MIENCEFPAIDTSYWKLDDKAWIAERKANWDVIEKYYSGGLEKSKKGMNIIKRYYLKGEMPDFEALRSWSDETLRHLDLYSFLWLHPSKDKGVLTELRNQYVNSPLVLEYDIKIGLGILFESGELIPVYDAKNVDLATSFNSGGINLLMFQLIVGDISKDYYPEERETIHKIEKFRGGYDLFVMFSRWLCTKKLSILSEDCLYQYDDYLNHWLKCCEKDVRFFEFRFKHYKDLLPLALHRINRFDVDKEGDTARGRFVHKIRKLLDEHEFHPTLKELWAEIKSDTNDVKGLWRL